MKALKLFLLFALGGLLAAQSSDILADLGVTRADLRRDVLPNLTEPQWFFFHSTKPMRKLARQLPEGSRATAVRALGKVVRAYCASDEFRQDYLGWLKTQYPYDDKYTDERLAEQEQNLKTLPNAANQAVLMAQQSFASLDPAMLYAGMKMQVPQRERELANLSGDERAEQARELADLKKMLAATEGKPAEFKKQFLAYQTRRMQQAAAGNVAEQGQNLDEARQRNAEYRRQKAFFDAHSDFRPLLRQRLTAFVALCNDVDFKASLMPSGARREFVDPVYQRKPAEWKFLYRLGPEATLAARTFAQEWLTGLEAGQPASKPSAQRQ
ncbi:MAG: hypothetical protein H7Y12_16140 [Sphingobacteriaceae bacterium]|nr:hypothetical protein [Cytophagaceae bacterium]